MLKKIKNRLNELSDVEKIVIVGIHKNIPLDILAKKMKISEQELIDLQIEDYISNEMFSKFCEVFEVPEDIVRNLNELNIIDFIITYCNSEEINNAINDYSQLYQLSFNPIEEILKLYTRLFLSEREKLCLLKASLKRNLKTEIKGG